MDVEHRRGHGPLADRAGGDRAAGSRGYRKAVVLGIAYSATIGGVGSAIGTPANPLAISFIERLTGREISFAEWFGFGLPMVSSSSRSWPPTCGS